MVHCTSVAESEEASALDPILLPAWDESLLKHSKHSLAEVVVTISEGQLLYGYIDGNWYPCLIFDTCRTLKLSQGFFLQKDKGM